MTRRSKTHEEYVLEVSIKNPNIEVVGHYINFKTKIPHKCLIHNYIWDALPGNILKGCGCINCRTDASIKASTYNTEDYKNQLLELGKNIEPIEEYKGIFTKIKHKCNNCGCEWIATPVTVKQSVYSCPDCYKEAYDKNIKSRTRTTEEYKMLLADRNIEILENYSASQTPLLHRCSICNNEWRAIPNNIIRGHGCPHCSAIETSKRMKYTDEEFIYEFKKRNPFFDSFVVKTSYINVSTPVICECTVCGHEWETAPYNLLAGKGCHYCNNSYGEKTIENYLLNNSFIKYKDFIPQKTFEDLRGINNGLLSYDFYIPSDKIAIEYQGEQHYKPVEIFGGKEHFNIQQEHDKRKREYAEKNGITLIEIPYKYKNRINEFLEENLIISTLTTAG